MPYTLKHPAPETTTGPMLYVMFGVVIFVILFLLALMIGLPLLQG